MMQIKIEMKTKLEIGIVVPVHNSEKALDRCVESIVNQTYKDLQIILVENGSTDNSYSMCLEWAKKDNRIKVVKSEKGVSKARNAGTKAALESGCSYIAYIDSDDYISSDMYEKLYIKAQECDADIVFCNYAQVRSDAKKDVAITKKAQKAIIDHDYKYFFYQGKNWVMGSSWRTLFSAEICRNIAFCENVFFAEDLIYVLNALNLSNKIAFIDDVLYYYNISPPAVFKYDTLSAGSERETYYKELSKTLVGKNKKYCSMAKVIVLINTITAIIKSHEDYKERIAELYKIEFYRDARRQFCGMLRLILLGSKGLRSKVAALVLYLGMYDFYAKHMTKEHG